MTLGPSTLYQLPKGDILLKYPGQKAGLSGSMGRWMPEHRIRGYVFGGGLGVAYEHFNEINTEITDFMEVVRDYSGLLGQYLDGAAYSSEALIRAQHGAYAGEVQGLVDVFGYQIEDLDLVRHLAEIAVRERHGKVAAKVTAAGDFMIGSWLGREQYHRGEWAGFRKVIFNRNGGHRPEENFSRFRDRIHYATARMRGLQVHNLDYRVFVKPLDILECFQIWDSPYNEFVRSGKLYTHELMTIKEHTEILDAALAQENAMVMVCGIAHELYEKKLEKAGWIRIDKITTNQGNNAYTESIRLNPAAWIN